MLMPTCESFPVALDVRLAEQVGDGADVEVAGADVEAGLLVVLGVALGFEAVALEELEATPGKHWE